MRNICTMGDGRAVKTPCMHTGVLLQDFGCHAYILCPVE